MNDHDRRLRDLFAAEQDAARTGASDALDRVVRANTRTQWFARPAVLFATAAIVAITAGLGALALDEDARPAGTETALAPSPTATPDPTVTDGPTTESTPAVVEPKPTISLDFGGIAGSATTTASPTAAPATATNPPPTAVGPTPTPAIEAAPGGDDETNPEATVDPIEEDTEPTEPVVDPDPGDPEEPVEPPAPITEITFVGDRAPCAHPSCLLVLTEEGTAPPPVPVTGLVLAPGETATVLVELVADETGTVVEYRVVSATGR